MIQSKYIVIGNQPGKIRRNGNEKTIPSSRASSSKAASKGGDLLMRKWALLLMGRYSTFG
jgi:hypothetical protein